MKRHLTFSRLTLSDWLCLSILLAAIALSAVTAFYVSQNILDSDASAEMVLAHHLASEGKLLSHDWYYSTELRVLHMHLIFAPLFKLFTDWSLVRFTGTVILQLLLLASYGYLIRKSRLNRKVFLLGGALLLMPVSVIYGRFVLYHVHYTLHIIISFLLIAWLLAIFQDWKFRKTGWLVVHFILFLLLSWGSSLNGYRQIATTHMPLALLCVLWMWRAQDRQEGIRAFTMLAITCAGTFCGLLGLLQNMKWQQLYSFADYSGIRLEVITPEGLTDMLFGFMHLFGYRRGLPLLTKMGLLSLLSLPVAFCCLIHSTRSVMNRNVQSPIGARLIIHMLPCSLAIVVLIFLFTTQNVDAERYALPCAVWYIPLLAYWITAQPVRKAEKTCFVPEWITAPRLIAVALWGICMLNGFLNVNSFIHPNGFNQEYTGLTLNTPDYVSYIDDVEKKLTEHHYDLGYSTFWEGNVLTELTDGKIPVVNLRRVDTPQGIAYYDWLTLESNRFLSARKPFLLITWDLEDWINGTVLGPLIQKAHEVNGYIIYDIPNLEAFRAALAA